MCSFWLRLLMSLLLCTLCAMTQGTLNDTEIGKAIKDIFRLDDRPGTRRFHTQDTLNDTEIGKTIKDVFRIDGTNQFHTPTEGIMYGHQPAQNAPLVNSELQLHPFKVHRSPDGKLNVIFNDLVSLQTEAPYLTPRTPISDTFIYPTTATLPPRQSNPPTTVLCKDQDGTNKTYCSDVLNYPKITAVRADLHSKFSSFFGNDLLDTFDIANRMGDESHEKYLCRSRERVIYPRSGKTKGDEDKLIVNDGEFKQGVRIEECIDQGAQCEHMAGLENNYVSECKQRHTARLLVSVSPDGSVVQKEHFSFPSCCKCVVRYKAGR